MLLVLSTHQTIKEKPRWILDLMQDPFWKQTLLELLDMNPSCAFLLYAKQVQKFFVSLHLVFDSFSQIEHGGEHALELSRATDMDTFSTCLKHCLGFVFQTANSQTLYDKLDALLVIQAFLKLL
jgi:hypothetical protein